ncbi:uncharacterized protein LOC133737027 [Rosa rugosa]|uniref:uncharacterized protein LOC133737027 n=1 Tax=Rosa rugosa TaxID=74645 RepID=UPI002B400904|nr:uncharacterized protein LOC133737027 [Rosa rugosa]
MGCLLCLHTLENNLHVFVDCPYAQEVWYRAGLQLPTGPGDNFIDWFLGVINSLTKEQIARCLMLLWWIWKNKNSQLWEHKRQHASEAVLLTMGWYEEFKKVNVQPTEIRRQLVTWTRPQENWVKVNCDGAFQPATRKGGAGVVIRDANGDFQVGAARPLPLVTSPFHAELMVLKEGINLAVALQHEQVLFESDSSLLVQALHSTEPDLSTMSMLLDEIRLVLQNHGGYRINYVPREANTVAHGFASHALRNRDSQTWFVIAPEFIRDAIRNDCNR